MVLAPCDTYPPAVKHKGLSSDPHHRSPSFFLLLDCFPPSLPPVAPRKHCENHGAPGSSNFPGPWDPPNRVGHPSETGLDPPNRVGHLSQTSQDPPKRVGDLPNPVLPAILSQSYLAFPPRPRLCPQLGSILSFRSFEKTCVPEENRCLYKSDLTIHVVLNLIHPDKAQDSPNMIP
jgi:hypothetical protein